MLECLYLIDCCMEWTDTALNILFPPMLNHGIHCDAWQTCECRSWVHSCPCGLSRALKPSDASLLLYPRSSRSSYVDEDCDSLALCDPMQRVNCEVDSLPESCFDSGLSTLRDSNEYDSEVEYKHQRAFPRSHGMRESIAGDASDTDVSSGNHCSPRLILHRDLAPCSTLICHGNTF